MTLLLLAVLGLLGTHCGGGGSAAGGRPTSVGPGSGSLTVTLPNPASPGTARLSGSIEGGSRDVLLAVSPSTAWYTVDLLDASGQSATGPMRLEPVPGQSTVSATFRNLVPGNFTVLIQSYDSGGGLLGRGSSPVTIVAGQVSSVTVSVTPVVSPSPYVYPTPTTYVFSRTWGGQGDSSTQFTYPHGIASDPVNGYIFVSDTDNKKIKKYLPDGTWLSTYGPILMARGIAVRKGGNVVFGDSGYLGGVVTYRAIEYDPASNTQVNMWGSAGANDGQFQFPLGAASSRTQDRVYILEYDNQRVQAFDLLDGSWTFATKWGSPGTADGQFNNPEGICTDAAGNVYVADSANNRIQKFTSTGTHLMTFGSAGNGPGQLNGPNGVTVDDQGCIYVAEFWNSRIQKFAPDGTPLCIFGNTPGTGQLLRPYSLTWYQGSVYVADTYNHRVVVFDPVP